MKSKRLIFFGNERLATGVSTDAPILRALIEHGYQIEAVIASNEDPVSRQKRDLEIGQLAHDHHIPVLLAGKIELLDKLKKHPASAGILVAFGKLVPQSVIDYFPSGIINIHPSLLPKMRGSTPIESAILDGLTVTGVSLMKLAAELDSGPVYAQAKLDLSGDETKQQLADKLARLGAELLIKTLPGILNGSNKGMSQNDSEASYTRRLTKEDGVIDLSKSAVQLEREIRAFQAWPRSRTNIFGQDIIVTKSRVASSATDGDLILSCQPGYLEVIELLAPSGRTITGAEFIRGYKK